MPDAWQGLVNVEMGDAALSLEEQLHRGVASVSGFKSAVVQAQAELEELEQVRFWPYAEFHPSAKFASIGPRRSIGSVLLALMWSIATCSVCICRRNGNGSKRSTTPK